MDIELTIHESLTEENNNYIQEFYENQKSVYDSKVRMDDVNSVIKKKYAKEAAMQKHAMDLHKELSILDDPLIKKIRENEVF